MATRAKKSSVKISTTILKKFSSDRDKKINKSFSENALKMMRKRYLVKDEKGNQEMPADMFFRVARTLAEMEGNFGRDKRFIDKTTKEFFDVLANKEFTPAGRSMTNIGAETAVVANCIVLPVLDSMESIFQT